MFQEDLWKFQHRDELPNDANFDALIDYTKESALRIFGPEPNGPSNPGCLRLRLNMPGFLHRYEEFSAGSSILGMVVYGVYVLRVAITAPHSGHYW